MSTAVLLLSDKRSGSTMLQEEICRHPGARHVDYSPHTYFETHHWLKAAVILGRPDTLFASERSYRGYGSRENARAYMIETLERNIPDYVPPATDRELVFDGWEALCGRFATPVFFEKSPQNLAQWAALSLMLEWIGRTSMTVRVIFLVRNPLAVQYSAKKLFDSSPELRQFAWLHAQRNLLAFRTMLPADMGKLVRYEDLVADPNGTLAEILGFIGLQPDAEVGKHIHASSTEKWRSDPSFTLDLDPSVRQMAMGFGYGDRDLRNPNANLSTEAGAGAERSRQGLRLWLNRRRDRLLRPSYLRLRSVFGKGG
jgi:hypothetical protein